MSVTLPTLPVMYAHEIAALDALIDKLRPWRVLEWGAGASTLYWPARYPETEWLSIEHDPEWYAAVNAQKKPNVTLRLLKYPEYYSLTPADVGLFPLIIVDGRERVRCLSAARWLLSPGGMALLHDSGRARYDAAATYYATTREICPPTNRRDRRGLRAYLDPLLDA